jgi:hypothetical protein
MKCKCCGQEIRQPTSEKFNEFWEVYPTKVGKKRASTTWKSRKLDRIAETIINNVRNRVSNDPRWQAGYIPNPITYLNGDLWLDEIDSIPVLVQWPIKNEDWLALGNKHRISPKTGESWPDFKVRVREQCGGRNE